MGHRPSREKEKLSAPAREPCEEGSRVGAETSLNFFFFITWSVPYFSLKCTFPARRASAKPLTSLNFRSFQVTISCRLFHSLVAIFSAKSSAALYAANCLDKGVVCGITKSNPSLSRSRERRTETAGDEVHVATADLVLHLVLVFSPGLAERVVKSDAGIHVHQVCLVSLEFAFISEERQERAVLDVFT